MTNKEKGQGRGLLNMPWAGRCAGVNPHGFPGVGAAAQVSNGEGFHASVCLLQLKALFQILTHHRKGIHKD